MWPPVLRRSPNRTTTEFHAEELDVRVLASATISHPVVSDDASVIEDNHLVGLANFASHATACQCQACIGRILNSGRTAWAIPAIDSPIGPEATDPIIELPYPGQTFSLHSRPSASRKIFLDFDGHTTSGTWWNSDITNGSAIVSQPFNMDGNDSLFSLSEQLRIQRIWQRVMEDYSPFDVDVTTEDPGLDSLIYSGANDHFWGIRVVISPTDTWARPTWGRVGGLAYMSSFRTGSDTSCFIFTSNLGPNNEGFIAEAISHEVGHTLGLSHDGTSQQGYYSGHAGANSPTWAPIMGVGYGKQVVQWSRGEYANANQYQDDLSIITNVSTNFGYRPDEVGNDITSASYLPNNQNQLFASSVIERTDDIDVYRFLTGAGEIQIDMTPWQLSPNLDIKAEIRNRDGSFAITVDPSDRLDASIRTTIPEAGEYYLLIEGVGVGSPATNGYSDYGSIGQYSISGTVISPITIGGLPESSIDYIVGSSSLSLPNITIQSADPTLSKLLIDIAHFSVGDDFNYQANPDLSVQQVNGQLIISGQSPIASYLEVLQSITFQTTATGNNQERVLTYSVWDRFNNSVSANPLTINIVHVNSAPTLDPIENQLILEDAGTVSIPLTGISAGDSEEQQLTFSVETDSPTLILNPSISESGQLTFTVAENQHGTAHISITLQDDGGTANGGINQVRRTFSITVEQVNDPPDFTMVNSSINIGHVAGVHHFPNWLQSISTGPADETIQSWQIITTTQADTVFTSLPSISSDGTLSFAVQPNTQAIVTITVRIQDDGGIDNGGNNTSRSQSITLYIGHNKPPVLAQTTPIRLSPIATNDHLSSGIIVHQLTDELSSDPDSYQAIGVGISAVTADNGKWQYSLDNTKSWIDIGIVSDNSVLLLESTDRLRFISTNGTSGIDSLKFYAWDQSSGLRGTRINLGDGCTETSPLSSASQWMQIAILHPLEIIPEDKVTRGQALLTIPGAQVVDHDLNAKRGYAITGLGGEADGFWQYSLNRGRTWTAMESLSMSRAILLRDTDMIRFIPSTNEVGNTYLTYHAWDQSSGTVGQFVDLTVPGQLGGSWSFSEEYGTIMNWVQPMNDRPMLDPITKVLSYAPNEITSYSPTEPISVETLMSTAVTDVDRDGSLGVAITKLQTERGIWEYQLAGQTEWLQFPKLSSQRSLLLNKYDQIRFTPFRDSWTSAEIVIKAWDGTTGLNGQATNTNIGTTFSTNIKSILLKVGISTNSTTPTNSIAEDTVVQFDRIREDQLSQGQTVASLIPNGSQLGIAITGLQGEQTGTWQFSLNAGRTWQRIPKVSEEGALLLKSSNLIRYVPNLNWHGEATIIFNAWNQSNGSAGKLADISQRRQLNEVNLFGFHPVIAKIMIESVNDAPRLDISSQPILPQIIPNTFNPTGTVIEKLIGTSIRDVDTDNQQGIAVRATSTVNGRWEYRCENTLDWLAFPNMKASEVFCLRPNDQVRFVPRTGWSGKEILKYHAWDQSRGHSGMIDLASSNTSISKAIETASITVSSTRMRPIIDPLASKSLYSVNSPEVNIDGMSVNSIIDNRVSVEGEIGIAITKIDHRIGDWQYSADGVNWFHVGSVSPNRALLLTGSDRLRFVPRVNVSGVATLDFKAWIATNLYERGTKTRTSSINFSSTGTQHSLLINSAPQLITDF